MNFIILTERLWRPVDYLCGACSLDYDFVLKQENGLEEFDFIATLFQHATDKHHYRTKPRRKMDMMAYFRDVSYETLVVLFKKYFFDFMAFGYRPDEYFRFSRKYESDSKELQYLRFWTVSKNLK